MNGVTIGQAAAFVGVTVKTVRHYTSLALSRSRNAKSSGYRRYDRELAAAVQVRTLAAAGVPLAEIGPLIDAGPRCSPPRSPTSSAAHRTDRGVDRAARDTLRRLADGDRALLGDRAVALLSGCPASDSPRRRWRPPGRAGTGQGPGPRGLRRLPHPCRARLEDPRFVALIKRATEAASWGTGTTRASPRLATAMADHFLANPNS